MDIYLPIANLSVNALVIILLGGAVGMLSGMFGVGGGFLTTPLLIFYGIPPTVAAASASTQVTGASVSGVFAHMKRDGVDFQMGAVLVVGGIFGTLAGAVLFEILEKLGQKKGRQSDTAQQGYGKTALQYLERLSWRCS